MSLDSVLLVVVDGSQANQAELRVVAHRLLVDVDAFFRVLYQVAVLNEVQKVCTARRVNFISVGVLISCHGDFWLVHVEEAHRIAVGHGAGLFRVKRVVSWRDDLTDILLVCKEAFEGTNFDHVDLFLDIF